MAVGAIYRGDVSEAQYQRVHQQVTPGSKLPPGLLYHVAGQGEDGWYVVEIWESQQAMQRFFDEKLGAALREANITVQPTFFRVAKTMQP